MWRLLINMCKRLSLWMVSRSRACCSISQKHILHGSRGLPDVATPKEMPKPRHMNRNVSKVDVQIADMSDPFPCLFDMPEPHRQMEPIKNMRHGLTG